ncbi:MAG: hypothetical protein HC903_25280 [Methylacidiphilales bacterium]|nr:hypothetical protein [Candidatus Methylacidiphilales bacterium]NJR17032.1 hypothetical protein [Calothrix sp. CSU_2_0]
MGQKSEGIKYIFPPPHHKFICVHLRTLREAAKRQHLRLIILSSQVV